MKSHSRNKIIYHIMNILTHTSNVTKSLNLQALNNAFKLLHFNVGEEIESRLLVNNQIHGHNTRSNNQMSILRVNRSKTKYCVLHSGMTTCNYLPDVLKSTHPFRRSGALIAYEIFIWIIIIYHDFLPTPRRGSHVKSDKTDIQTSRYTPLSPYT